MKKTYNITLSKSDYSIVKPYLRDSLMIYESSSYYDTDIYLSLKLNINEYNRLSEFLENNI